MGFFARGGGQDDGQQAAALARIEAGGIPAQAEERLGDGARCARSPRPGATSSCRTTRRRSMRRASWPCNGMQSEAQELEAEGIVGVSLSERSHGWGSHVIEFFALGTAIVSTGEGTKIEPPVTVLDLNDSRS
jgi:hypothetical protein